MNDEIIKELKKISNVSKSATMDDIERVVSTFLEALKKLKNHFDSNTAEKTGELAKDFTEAFSRVDEIIKELKSIVSLSENKFSQSLEDLGGRIANELNSMKETYSTEIGRVESLIPSLPDNTPIENKLMELDKKEITPEEVRDKLEILKNDERLDKSAIKGLEDEIRELRKEIATKIISTGGGSRRVFQPYRDDFSALTNGSTKTFYLSREPLKTDTIMVFGTDFPVILRPTTDFTVSSKTLTLTSAVPAPSSGATLVIIYFA